MEKIKFGVVGTIRGLTFVKLLQVFGEQVCLHAVCENDAVKAEAVKQEIPEESAFIRIMMNFSRRVLRLSCFATFSMSMPPLPSRRLTAASTC